MGVSAVMGVQSMFFTEGSDINEHQLVSRLFERAVLALLKKLGSDDSM